MEDLLFHKNSILSKLQEGNEYEVIALSAPLDRVYNIKQYMKSKQLSIQTSTIVSCIYTPNTGKMFRIHINDNHKIIETMEMYELFLSHDIFNTLLKDFANNNNPTMMNIDEKTLEQSQTFKNLQLKSKLSKEIVPSNNVFKLQLLEKDHNNVKFRLKNRYSMVYFEDEHYRVSLDLSSTNIQSHISKLSLDKPEFELEFEVFKKSNNNKHVQNIIDMTDKLLTEVVHVWHQTNTIISSDKQDTVKKTYMQLFNINESHELYHMPQIMLNIEHAINNLQNDYCVTDKTNGETCHLLVLNDNLYELSNSLNVKKIDRIDLEKGSLKTTIILAEYINNRYLCYDTLYYDNNDVRNKTYIQRFSYVNSFLDIVNPSHFKLKSYTGSLDSKDILSFLQKNIELYINHINEGNNIIDTKFVVSPINKSMMEIFQYSTLIWKLFAKANYKVSGLLMIHSYQMYTHKIDLIKHNTYIWKPIENITLNVYVEFYKNNDSYIVNVYDNRNNDNSVDNAVINENKAIEINTTDNTRQTTYHIAYMYVEDIIKRKQQKYSRTPFFLEKDINYIYLYTDKNNNVLDMNGNIVMDNVVVELQYNADMTVEVFKRWQVKRTLYDKTENVRQHNIQFGDSKDIVMHNWQTIQKPCKLSDLEKLAQSNDNVTFIQQLNNLAPSKNTKDPFLPKNNNDRPIRHWLNWIKSLIMYNYYDSVNSKNPLDILDIGCGKAIDLQKFYHTRYKSLWCIDTNIHDLFGAMNSAKINNKKWKKMYPDYVLANIVNADLLYPIDIKYQQKVITSMTQANKNNIKELKKTKFDGINCMFYIQDAMKDKESLTNFMNNISKFIKKSGYFICITLDGDKILELLDKNTHYDEYYTDVNGDKQLLFSIKINNTYKKLETGCSYDFINALEDSIQSTSYLVSYDYLINVFEEYNFELYESQNFEEYYKNATQFFEDYISNETELSKHHKFVKDSAVFYKENINDDSLHSSLLKMANLHRYYVFQSHGKVLKK